MTDLLALVTPKIFLPVWKSSVASNPAGMFFETHCGWALDIGYAGDGLDVGKKINKRFAVAAAGKFTSKRHHFFPIKISRECRIKPVFSILTRAQNLVRGWARLCFSGARINKVNECENGPEKEPYNNQQSHFFFFLSYAGYPGSARALR